MRVYETFEKINSKYYFLGWYEMRNEDYCIKTVVKKINGKEYIYKTYNVNGVTEEVKYGSYLDK
jgi:hypothetical protein